MAVSIGSNFSQPGFRMQSLPDAIREGDVETIKGLIPHGVDVNQPCHDGELPLAKAIGALFSREVLSDEVKTRQHLEIIDVLLSQGAHARSIMIGEKALLFYLCDQARGFSDFFFNDEATPKKEELACQVVDKLFAAPFPPDVNEKNEYQQTPLLYASLRLAKLFFKWGANIAQGSAKTTVLHCACQEDDLVFIEELLGKEPTLLNAEGQGGLTPLDYAKKAETMLFLLKRGAKSKQRDIFYFFQEAQSQENPLLLDYLLENGLLTYHNPQGYSALHYCRSLSATELLLHKGALSSVRKDLLFNLLFNFFSDEKGRLDYLRLLHAHGLDFNLVDAVTGEGFLHLCYCDGLDFIRALVTFGVPLNVLNRKGATALHQMAEWGLLPEMQYLIEAGADSSLCDLSHQVPLEKIKFQNVQSQRSFSPTLAVGLLEHLLQAFAGLPQNGIELLFLAIHCNALPIVQELCKRKASLVEKHPLYQINAIERAAQENRPALLSWMLSQVKSPLQDALSMAITFFHFECVEALLAAGADANGRNSRNQLALVTFASVLDSALGEFNSPEERQAAAITTLRTLFQHQLNIEIPDKPGALLVELMDYQGRNWPVIQLLLYKKASLPSQKSQIIQLANWAAQHADGEALKYIVESCPTVSWRQDLLTSLAQKALRRADLKLLDQCIAWGMHLHHPLLDHRLHGYPHYLLDEVSAPALICYLIQKGAVLHYPKAGENSLLHRAAEAGWLEVVKLLLEPGKGFTVDMWNCNQNTPMQVAAKHGQTAMVNFLLIQGADPLVLDPFGSTLVQLACQRGHVETLELLLKTKIDRDTHSHTYLSAPIYTAAHYEDKVKAEQMVSMLLKAGVKWNFSLLLTVILRHFNDEILHDLLSQSSIADIFDHRLLHVAVSAGNGVACKFLLNHYPDQIDLPDNQGRTCLHLATAPGREDLFKELSARGANLDSSDYAGFSVAMHAAFHGTHTALGLDPKIDIDFGLIRRLSIQLMQLKEFQRSDTQFLLYSYSYKLLSIFISVENALKFIQQHQNSRSSQPIHDLCLFQLPSRPYQYRLEWIGLLLQYGPQLTPFIHLAPRIEQLLGRAPETIDEIKQTAAKIKYSRELESADLAELLHSSQVPEEAFNRVLSLYKPKQHCHLPDLLIDGAVFNEPRFYLKKLADHDLRGFILGEMTHCCQSVGSAGETCAMHGMSSTYSGFYVVFKRTAHNELQTMQEVRRYLQAAQNIEEFLAKFSQKSQRQKYKKMHEELGNFALLREKLAKDFTKMEEGELVAQMWAWISHSGALVLDSWERLREEDDRLCPLFLKHLALEVKEKHPSISQVFIGASGQTPENLPFERSSRSEVPKEYFGYRDSSELYLISTQFKAVEAEPVLSQIPVAKPSPTYTSEEMVSLLKHIFASDDHVTLLPPQEDQMKDFTKLPEKKPAKELDKTYIGILPLLNKDKYWTACLIEYGLTEDYQGHHSPWSTITYLDLSRGPLPQGLCSNPFNISQMPLIYNQNLGLSGPWLVKILQKYRKSRFIEIEPYEPAASH